MGKIILLKDFYKLKEQKEKELKFYREQMSILEEKMTIISCELTLTKTIIKMIEDESIINVDSI